MGGSRCSATRRNVVGVSCGPDGFDERSPRRVMAGFVAGTRRCGPSCFHSPNGLGVRTGGRRRPGQAAGAPGATGALARARVAAGRAAAAELSEVTLGPAPAAVGTAARVLASVPPPAAIPAPIPPPVTALAPLLSPAPFRTTTLQVPQPDLLPLLTSRPEPFGTGAGASIGSSESANTSKPR